MNKMNLNTVNGLIKLKDTFNELISERIIDAKLNNAINVFNECGIGEVKYIFESISDKLFETNEGKTIIKNYVNTITKDKGLSNFFSLFETIKNVKNTDNPNLFINEALSLNKSLNEASVLNIKNIVKEGVRISGLNDDELNTLLSNYKNSYDSNISYILSERKTKKNVLEYSNNMNKVCEAIKDTKNTVVENISNKEILDSLSNVIEESDITNKNILKDITLYTVSGKGNKALFEDYKKNCINTMNETLDKCDSVQDKNRFQVMLEQLSAKNYTEETFIEDILKLSELNETLKSN